MSCRCGNCARPRASPSSSTAPSRWARSRSTSRVSTSSRSRARSGCAARTRPGRWSSPTPIACAWRRRATSPRPGTSAMGPSCPGRRRTLRGGLVAGLVSLRPARGDRHPTHLELRPCGEHRRPLPGDARRRVSRSSFPTALDARCLPCAAPPGVGDAAAIVQSLYAAGVHVREIPGTGLIRVSCGWWTSVDDLDRLVAALPA